MFGYSAKCVYLCIAIKKERCVVRTVRYWSAKPLKAVRLRHAPQSKSEAMFMVSLFSCLSYLILSYPILSYLIINKCICFNVN